MRIVVRILLIYALLINLLTFIFYGIDKYKAKHGTWRISEARLLWLAFFGGSIGALSGMSVFHHKTKHLKFYILIPLFLLLHIALIALPYYYLFILPR